MAKVLLIHGYAVGLTSLWIRKPFGPSAGFRALETLVKEGNIRVFRWGWNREVSLFELFNPFAIYHHYQTERHMAVDGQTQQALREALVREQPETIVCHSMGCTLLATFLQRFALPTSVRRVIFIQSDLPAATPLPSAVAFEHWYCPWDPTLLVSSLLGGGWKAGLRPSSQPAVHNRFVPLLRPWNLHTSSIRSPRLKQFLLKQG